MAAVERSQKLEEDRQRMRERGGPGKRPAADLEPEQRQGATRQKGVKVTAAERGDWRGAMGEEVSGGADSSGSAVGGGVRMGKGKV